MIRTTAAAAAAVGEDRAAPRTSDVDMRAPHQASTCGVEHLARGLQLACGKSRTQAPGLGYSIMLWKPCAISLW